MAKKIVAIFPFSAIIGQDEMKLALQLNVIDPRIGGVMIMGDRGTGKSTTVRALADLLPEIEVIKDDIFNLHPDDIEKEQEKIENKKVEIISIKTPLIDLPLGATEDRVCGTIDIQQALTDGTKLFEPGLLAKANRGILYIDEINLLDDHLVDIILDSSASGWNIVEREGISIKHPSKFVLIGSGNPEEGELRPQLLDRFGMHAEIKTIKDPYLRVKIVNERLSFDKYPEKWLEVHREEQEKLKIKIINAKNFLPKVKISDDFKIKISKICSQLDIDGLRGDLVCNRAACAIAAFEEKENVTVEDIEKTIVLCLRHRLKKDPMETIDSKEKIQKIFQKNFFF
jgi:magnesium chelatase subunit I